MSDYPAAHSMDTDWFAVDACGHVALFDSGEEGAVPLDQRETDALEALRALSKLMPRTTPVFVHRSRFEPFMEVRHWLPDHECDHPMLMFLCMPERVADVIAREQGVRVPSEGPPAYLFPKLSERANKTIHGSESCAGCTWGDAVAPRARELGIYTYGQVATACSGGGPYGMETRPPHPLRVGDLPKELRAAFSKLIVKACFETLRYFQPAEHVPCVTYGALYLSSDFKTIRCTPGREEEYRQWHAGREDWTGRYEIEPPKRDAPGAQRSS